MFRGPLRTSPVPPNPAAAAAAKAAVQGGKEEAGDESEDSGGRRKRRQVQRWSDDPLATAVRIHTHPTPPHPTVNRWS